MLELHSTVEQATVNAKVRKARFTDRRSVIFCKADTEIDTLSNTSSDMAISLVLFYGLAD